MFSLNPPAQIASSILSGKEGYGGPGVHAHKEYNFVMIIITLKTLQIRLLDKLLFKF